MKNKILFLFLPCMCICTMLVSIVGLVMSKTHNQSLNFVYLSAISCLVSIAVLLNDVLNNKKN